jgi:threonine dehydrogenase-like Zn-dependent dehydrogenase
VLVIGGGPIGLCTMAVARHLGGVVEQIANRPERQAAAEQLGVRAANGTNYDIVLDAAGTQSSIDRATALVRPGGTLGILANFWQPVTIGISLLMKEVALVPAFTYGHHHGDSEFDEAVQLLGALPELPRAVITHRFPLVEAHEAFRLASDPRSAAIKVVIEP